MKTMIRKIVVLTLSLALIANTGCASVRTIEIIEATEAAVVEHNVKVGDEVRLHRPGHPTEDVRILKLSESELTATRQDGTVIVVDWRDIAKLGVKRTKIDLDDESVDIAFALVFVYLAVTLVLLSPLVLFLE